MSRRKPPVPVAEPAYEPTDSDREAMATFEGRAAARGRLAGVKIEQKGQHATVVPNHPDLAIGSAVLANAIGTVSGPFVDQLLSQVLAGAKRPDGTIDANAVNAALALIQGIQPRDEVEALLAVQMVQINAAITKASATFRTANQLPQWTAAELALNRLARTYTQQIEALKRYRSTGEQRVVVQHVNVGDGGQAIVGDIHHTTAPGNRSPALEHSSGVLIDTVATPERGRGDR